MRLYVKISSSKFNCVGRKDNNFHFLCAYADSTLHIDDVGITPLAKTCDTAGTPAVMSSNSFEPTDKVSFNRSSFMHSALSQHY